MMGFRIRHNRPSEAELARLADGSTPAARRSELRARVDASPELAHALAEQEQAVAMLRSLDERAPTALRTRIEAMTAAPSAAARRPRIAPGAPARRPRRIALGAAAALALAAAALLAVTQVGGALPSVPQTARLALAPATTVAPAEDAAHGALAIGVDRLSFPYWRASFGWRAVGSRTDVLNARRIVTVYYTDSAGSRVGYSIVAGAALTTPGGEVLKRQGVRYRLISVGSLRVITWLRSGHTCILAGQGVSDRVLLRLARGNRRQFQST